MNWIVHNTPYLLLVGLIVLLVGFTVIAGTSVRRACRVSGSIMTLLGLFGVVVLIVSPPGREEVEEERRDDDDPSPRSVLTIQETLELPWSSEEAAKWPAAELMAHLCEVAYQEPVDARTAFETFGFISETITAASMIGYVLAAGDSAVVVLRGTDDSPDWIRNISFLPARTEDGPIHGGFYTAYQPLHPQIAKLLGRFQSKRVWVTGHSLGGALAIVAAYHLIKQGDIPLAGVMTFGQPMVVGQDVRDFLKPLLNGKYVHFVNETDPVARVITPFEHFGTLVWLRDGIIVRSTRHLMAATSEPSNLGELPALESLTPEEFEGLKVELEQAQQMRRAQHDGDGGKVMKASFPTVYDHLMPQYIRMIEKISKLKRPLSETLIQEK